MAITTTRRSPAPIFSGAVAAIEQRETLDAIASQIEPLADRLRAEPAGSVLRGDWLGHALHPLLTDLPIGCWTSATLVDLLGGERGAPAAQRLVGLGLLFTVPTVVTGLVDWAEENGNPAIRRVGVVHAVGNVAAALVYLQSWRARRAGRRRRGIVLGLAAGGLASFTGFLGGHMAFALGSRSHRG